MSYVIILLVRGNSNTEIPHQGKHQVWSKWLHEKALASAEYLIIHEIRLC